MLENEVKVHLVIICLVLVSTHPHHPIVIQELLQVRGYIEVGVGGHNYLHLLNLVLQCQTACF